MSFIMRYAEKMLLFDV